MRKRACAFKKRTAVIWLAVHCVPLCYYGTSHPHDIVVLIRISRGVHFQSCVFCTFLSVTLLWNFNVSQDLGREIRGHEAHRSSVSNKKMTNNDSMSGKKPTTLKIILGSSVVIVLFSPSLIFLTRKKCLCFINLIIFMLFLVTQYEPKGAKWLLFEKSSKTKSYDTHEVHCSNPNGINEM